MEIARRKDHLELSELDPFLAELLRQVPASARVEGDPVAEARIYSAPCSAPQDELCSEWKAYVKPELRRLFQTAIETVSLDLAQLNGNEKTFANRSLKIPADHAEAWLSALNQARLVITAKNDFNESELGDHCRSPIGSRRDLSLFQVNFYGFLQEFILREINPLGTGD
jgi:Domain of unknown function (DUF2017)